MGRPDRIHFTCPQCGIGVRAPFELAGRRAKCKRCGTKIPVPTVAPPEPEPVEAELADEPLSLDESSPPLPRHRPDSRPRPPVSRPAPVVRPVTRGPRRDARRRTDDEYDDGRPGPSPQLWLVVAGGGLFLVAVVGLLVYFLSGSKKPADPADTTEVAAGSGSTPEKKESGDRGPAGDGPRDPAHPFTPEEVDAALKAAGFDVPTVGLVSQGNTLDGSIGFSTFEVTGKNPKSGCELTYVRKTTHFHKDGTKADTLTLSAARSAVTEAGFKAVAAKLHKTCADGFDRALAEARANGGQFRERVGTLSAEVSGETIRFEFSFPDKPRPAATPPKSAGPIDGEKLVGKWRAPAPTGQPFVIEFTADGRLTVTPAVDGANIKIEGTYKLDGSSLRITLTVNGRTDSTTQSVTRLTDDRLEVVQEDGKPEVLTRVRP